MGKAKANVLLPSLEEVLSRPDPSNQNQSKKKTIADFLAAADEMDPSVWEATWQKALEHTEDVVSDEEILISPGHFALEDAPPAEESATNSLMELLFMDAVSATANMRHWSEVSCKSWEMAVKLIAYAWNGRMIKECVDRFSAAIEVFEKRGEIAVELSPWPGNGASRVYVRSGSIELVEEHSEQVIPWLKRFLNERLVPYEYQRTETAVASAEGDSVNRRTTFRLKAQLA